MPLYHCGRLTPRIGKGETMVEVGAIWVQTLNTESGARQMEEAGVNGATTRLELEKKLK